MDVRNPFGDDPIDINEGTEASRIGQRIRDIRIEQGISQVSLGEEVGLTGARIYKYENGERKPKSDLLKCIAAALGVSTLALTDPVVSSYLGVAYAFFAMEKAFNLKYKCDDQGRVFLVFGDGKKGPINDIIRELEEKSRSVEAGIESATSYEERMAIEHEFNMWKWTYPHPKAYRDNSDEKLDEKQSVEHTEEEC